MSKLKAKRFLRRMLRKIGLRASSKPFWVPGVPLPSKGRKDIFAIAAYYFGNGSPLNMWSSIDESSLDGDLANLKDLGFNAIALLIPWSGFQRRLGTHELNPDYITKLRKIFDLCQSLKLGVILRLGYLWDSTSCDEPTYHRFRRIPLEEDILHEWLWFLKAMYAEANRPCHLFSFLSWEDFYWPIFRHYASTGCKEEVAAFLRACGYSDYISRFTRILERHHCEEVFDGVKPDEVPEKASAWYALYSHFYDTNIFKPIVDLSCIVFPGLSVEARVDTEWVRTLAETQTFYFWNTNYFSADRPIVYYHACIGNRTTCAMSEDEAVCHLASLLDRYGSMRRIGQKLPFVSQFNYVDNTCDDWATIAVKDGERLAQKFFEVLRKLSSGYAIWGVRDWRPDVVHNPFFLHGDDGWQATGDSSIEQGRVLLSNGGCISQQIRHLALPDSERLLRVKGRSNTPTSLSVTIGYTRPEEKCHTFHIKVRGPFSVHQRLPENGRISSIGIQADGEVELTEVRVLGKLLSQGFLNERGQPSSIARGLVKLQRRFNRR